MGRPSRHVRVCGADEQRCRRAGTGRAQRGSWSDLISRNSSMPNLPSSRPLPDCL
jgi:hypothetical protein